MRRTRFMTWFFLALSLALFCVPNFRPVLEAPLAVFLPDDWTGEYGASAWARETAEGSGRKVLEGEFAQSRHGANSGPLLYLAALYDACSFS